MASTVFLFLHDRFAQMWLNFVDTALDFKKLERKTTLNRTIPILFTKTENYTTRKWLVQ